MQKAKDTTTKDNFFPDSLILVPIKKISQVTNAVSNEARKKNYSESQLILLASKVKILRLD